MDYNTINKVLSFYTDHVKDFRIDKLSGGLINQSYCITDINTSQKYILQQVNTSIFEDTDLLMSNTYAILEHVREEPEENASTSIIMPQLYLTGHKKLYVQEADGSVWRLLDYIENKEFLDIDFDIAEEVGSILGSFHLAIDDLDPKLIGEVIPDFHNLILRYDWFLHIEIENNKRYEDTKDIYNRIQNYSYLVNDYKNITESGRIKLRISHNDPKLSNILFNEQKQAISIIDLDTIMPGYIQSDFGDAIRSLCNLTTEDDQEIANVGFSMERFKALATSYFEKVSSILSESEEESFIPFILFITYEQLIRFYGDYLQHDSYYQTHYPTQNLVRSQVQLKLLNEMAKNKIAMVDFLQLFQEL